SVARSTGKRWRNFPVAQGIRFERKNHFRRDCVDFPERHFSTARFAQSVFGIVARAHSSAAKSHSTIPESGLALVAKQLRSGSKLFARRFFARAAIAKFPSQSRRRPCATSRAASMRLRESHHDGR